MVSLWVVNASPIILLGKVSRIDLLRTLGVDVVIPDKAVIEIERGGTDDPGVRALASADWLRIVADPIPVALSNLNLGAGETAVLAHALANPGSGVILDDRAARNAAAGLGLPCLGTLGLILFAKTSGRLSAARPILESLRNQGMFLSDAVLNRALLQVGE